MLPKALKTCQKSNKSPNLVTLILTYAISKPSFGFCLPLSLSLCGCKSLHAFLCLSFVKLYLPTSSIKCLYSFCTYLFYYSYALSLNFTMHDYQLYANNNFCYTFMQCISAVSFFSLSSFQHAYLFSYVIQPCLSMHDCQLYALYPFM